MLDLGAYQRNQQRPDGRAVMLQSWRSLIFLHFPCDPEVVQSTLPPGLTVDTFPDTEGVERAWIGLVPFRMVGVRPNGLPAFAPISNFPETNVRTYVHHRGQDPGVWFYSLDAAVPMACKIARQFFGLPYREATMRVDDQDPFRHGYRSQRWNGPADLSLEVRRGLEVGPAEAGSFEFWLVERYVLFASRRGKLVRGQVHHAPYCLRDAEVVHLEESLIAAAGFETQRFVHVAACDGVDVEIFAPTVVR